VLRKSSQFLQGDIIFVKKICITGITFSACFSKICDNSKLGGKRNEETAIFKIRNFITLTVEMETISEI
jgi:hypothetical protein